MKLMQYLKAYKADFNTLFFLVTLPSAIETSSLSIS